jgi:hypothetical protein
MASSITLSDYIGFIFSEIIKGRTMADEHSKQIAIAYEKDDIMKHFSVPRFKIPELDLTIPVLIAGARYSSTLKFIWDKDDFIKYIKAKAANIEATIKLKNIKDIKDIRDINLLRNINVITPRKPKNLAPNDLDDLISRFYEALLKNNDPSNPDNIVNVMWGKIFDTILVEKKLEELYKKNYPNNELYFSTSKEILNEVHVQTIIDKSKIESLLVNPETQVVKTGSSDTSVFTVKAKIVEEGLFIRSIKDADGTEKKIAEFE